MTQGGLGVKILLMDSPARSTLPQEPKSRIHTQRPSHHAFRHRFIANTAGAGGGLKHLSFAKARYI
jgi:hypothetical protein